VPAPASELTEVKFLITLRQVGPRLFIFNQAVTPPGVLY